MSRFGTKLTAGAAVLALAAMPGTARAQDSASAKGVDERTGPAAFANAAALAIVDDGRGGEGGSVISETQRSPLLPGTSRLAQARSELPGTDAERNAVGSHYLVRLGEHDVTATLRDTHVPTATAKAGYALDYLGNDTQATTVLEFQSATSTVECAAPSRLRSDTGAERLRLIDADGKLTQVDLPEGTAPVTREKLPFGPPGEVENADAEITSDISVRRATSLDQLLRQDQWRGGDVTAAAGWLVEIVSHVEAAPTDERDTGDSTEGTEAAQNTEPENTPEETTPVGAMQPLDSAEPPETTGSAGDTAGIAVQMSEATASSQAPESGQPIAIKTRIVLGGVSCSLPRDFVALGQGGNGGGPTLPVTIPAGQSGAVASGAHATPGTAWGLGLLGGGVLLGALALLLVRSRTPVAPRRTSVAERVDER